MQVRLESFRVFKPDHLLAEDSSAVIEQRSRQALNASKLLLNVVSRYRQRIMDSNFLREHHWIFRVLHRVKLKADNSEPLGTVTVQEPLVAGHFLSAGLAPSGPKIDQNHFAMEVSRRNLPSLKVLHLELRQHGANFPCRD